MDESSNDFAIRLCSNVMNIEDVTTPNGKQFRLLNLPYYLAGFLDEIIDKVIS